MKKQFIIAVTAMVMYGIFQLTSAKQINESIIIEKTVCTHNETHTINNAPMGTAIQLPVIIHL